MNKIKPSAQVSAEGFKNKPVSRVLFADGNRQHAYHLSGPDKSGSIDLPTPMVLIAQNVNQEIQNRGLFDLSIRKVFHAPAVTIGAVGSYPTFSL